jgi:hypothetical protein
MDIKTNIQYGIKTFREGLPLDLEPIKFGFWYYVEAITITIFYWLLLSLVFTISLLGLQNKLF